MKTLAIILIAVITSLLPDTAARADSAGFSPVYAEIAEGCILYSDSGLTLPVVKLPATYFVTVIEKSSACLRVTYKNIDGYVSPESVTEADFTPKTKYASSKLTLLGDGGTVNIRSRPDHTADNVLARLSDGATLYYYGETAGTSQNEIIGEKWYCVELAEGGYGYVYSMYAKAEPIKENVIEAETPVTPPEPEKESSVSERGEYFFIAALCLPVIIFMYLLFKSDRNSSVNTSDVR